MLMLGGDHACNPRNPFPGEMHSARAPFHDLYPRGASIVREITVSAVLSTISGTLPLADVAWARRRGGGGTVAKHGRKH